MVNSTVIRAQSTGRQWPLLAIQILAFACCFGCLAPTDNSTTPERIPIADLSVKQLLAASEVVFVGQVEEVSTMRSRFSITDRLCGEYMDQRIDVRIIERVRGPRLAETLHMYSPTCVSGILHEEMTRIVANANYVFFLRRIGNEYTPVYPGSVFAIEVSSSPWDEANSMNDVVTAGDVASYRIAAWVARWSHETMNFRRLDEFRDIIGSAALVRLMLSKRFFTEQTASSVCSNLIEKLRLFHRVDVMAACRENMSEETWEFLRAHEKTLRLLRISP